MSDEGDSTRDSRVREVFMQACDLKTSEERTAFIKKACGDDVQMLREVESLLSVHEESNSLMELDLLKDIEEISNDMIGSKIGRYQILEKLGEGGFGEVFRVEQTEPIQRELALKIIKPGMDSKDVIRRFESERQALARLDHPNIAHITDAGTTDAGRPYFVMELACGEPITRYCDHHELSIDERLNLFRQVCHGVKHAHQKGIIHRDLNPANIVIVEQEGQHIPKIIDFGIAKSLQGHLTGKTVLTQRQFLVGTPEYMSPEQFTSSSSELEHRTDIYTLGSVLYELISGTTPVDNEVIRTAGISEIPRILSEDEPEKPSTRLRTVKDTKAIAENRGSTLSKLDHKLRGDLDRIIMKCLEKDRIRRYESVDDLDQDLKAFLECRPVQATAPSLLYRIRKFVRRNRQTLLTSTAASAVLVAILAILFAVRSRESISLNFDEIEKSIAVLPFEHRSSNENDLYFTDGIHGDLLGQISQIPGINVISRASVMEYRETDKNLKTIADELGVTMLIGAWVQRAGDTISIHIELIDPISNSQIWAHRYDRELTASNVFEVQSDIARSVSEVLKVIISPSENDGEETLPTNNLEALETYWRGIQCSDSGSMSGNAKAVDFLRKAVSIDPEFALAHAMLGEVLLRLEYPAGLPTDPIYSMVESHVNKALEIDDSLDGAYVTLGNLRMIQLNYSAAEKAIDRAIELNPNNINAYTAKANLVGIWVRDFPKVKSTSQERINLLQKAYELDPASEGAVYRLAQLLAAQGRVEEVLKIRKKLVERNPNNVNALKSLGQLLKHNQINQFDEAIVLFRKVHALDPGDVSVIQNLGGCYWNLNDYEEANWWYDRYLNIQNKDGRWDRIKVFKSNLVGNLDDQEKYALQGLERDIKSNTLLRHLSEVYVAKGQPMKARMWWEKAYPELFNPAVEIDSELLWQAKNLAYVLKLTGEDEQANRLIEKAWKVIKVSFPDGHPLLEAMFHIVAENDTKALLALRQYVDAGCPPRSIRAQSLFNPLSDNPEYQSILSDADANMAVQLNRLREMEANGELSPIPEIPDKLQLSEIPSPVETGF